MDVNEVMNDFFRYALIGRNFVSVEVTKVNENTNEKKDITIKVVEVKNDNSIPNILDSDGYYYPIIMLPEETIAEINEQLLRIHN